jgi:hypothetical protein
MLATSKCVDVEVITSASPTLWVVAILMHENTLGGDAVTSISIKKSSVEELIDIVPCVIMASTVPSPTSTNCT